MIPKTSFDASEGSSIHSSSPSAFHPDQPFPDSEGGNGAAFRSGAEDQRETADLSPFLMWAWNKAGVMMTMKIALRISSALSSSSSSAAVMMMTAIALSFHQSNHRYRPMELT
jgi:hypothetical protein